MPICVISALDECKAAIYVEDPRDIIIGSKDLLYINSPIVLRKKEYPLLLGHNDPGFNLSYYSPKYLSTVLQLGSVTITCVQFNQIGILGEKRKTHCTKWHPI